MLLCFVHDNSYADGLLCTGAIVIRGEQPPAFPAYIITYKDKVQQVIAKQQKEKEENFHKWQIFGCVLAVLVVIIVPVIIMCT